MERPRRLLAHILGGYSQGVFNLSAPLNLLMALYLNNAACTYRLHVVTVYTPHKHLKRAKIHTITTASRH